MIDKKPPYAPPPTAAVPATRPMAPDTGKRNALPKHAMHTRGRNRGMGKC